MSGKKSKNQKKQWIIGFCVLLIIAAALIVTQAVAAFAAPSKTTTPSATGYVVTTASAEAFADVKNDEIVNDLLAANNGIKTLAEVVEKTNPELKDQLTGKEMVSSFFYKG